MENYYKFVCYEENYCFVWDAPCMLRGVVGHGVDHTIVV